MVNDVDTLKWWDEHERLWSELVPASGQSQTVQGELIRCTGRFSDEAYRNGNANWDEGYERMLAFVARSLDDPNTFDAEQRKQLRGAIQSISAAVDAPDLSGHGSALYFLSEMAVRWCLKNPALVAHAKDPLLKR